MERQTAQHAQSMIKKLHGLVENAVVALAVQRIAHRGRVIASSTDHLCRPLSISGMTSVATGSIVNGDAKKSKPNLPIDKQVTPKQLFAMAC